MDGEAAAVHEQVRRTQIDQFNSNFNIYLNRNGITIYDIIKCAKFAYEFNLTTDNTDIVVEVRMKDNRKINLASEQWNENNGKKIDELLEKERDDIEQAMGRRDDELIAQIGSLPVYKCEDSNSEKAIEYDNDTGRIKCIRFKYDGST